MYEDAKLDYETEERDRALLVQSILAEVAHTLFQAEAKHPGWPDDPFHALAIIGEEFGELQQACLQHTYEGRGSIEDVDGEALQTAAMAVRFLLALRRDKMKFVPADQVW